MRFAGTLIATLLLATSPTLAPAGTPAASIPLTAGDIAPGTLDASTSPPTWVPQGDGVLSVADAVAMLRTAVGLQDILPADPDCPDSSPLPGDASPGATSESDTPPRWVRVGDGVLDVADVVAVLRSAVGLHEPSIDSGLPVGASLVGFECPVTYATTMSGNVTIEMVRTGDIAQPACVTYATSDGTAEAGDDYDPATGTLCFGAGESDASFTVGVHPPPGSHGESVILRAHAVDTPEPFILGALILETIRPIARVSPPRLRLGMPENCPEQFQVSNIGPAGSILQFSVSDDGALGGYLDVQVGATSLSSGQSSTVTVSVKDEFVGSAAGSTLVLHVDTPDASSFRRWPEMVRVRTNTPLGTWGGTWTGHGEGPQSQTTPVSGTWTLTLEAYDLASGAASGSLAWSGSDAYWSQQQEAFVPYPATSRTRTFDASNATLAFITTPQHPCGVYQLAIANTRDNPSDAFYGPAFGVQLDAVTGQVPDGPYGGSCECGPSGQFETHPYDPATMAHGRSVGRVQGARLP